MLRKFEDLFDELFSARQLIPAGIYQYQSDERSEFPFKLHLRVEPDGAGILIINASTVLHLNQTAAELAYHLIQGKSDEEIITLVAERYDAEIEQVKDDYVEFTNRMDALLQMEDLDPVTYLDIDRVLPYSQNLSAPYRMDLALTYQMREDQTPEAAPTDRVTKELTTKEWLETLEKIRDAGVPHVVFTGGEPTLREDLPELILAAEELGVVCGLLTDSIGLTSKKSVDALLQNGLDHIMILADANNKKFWQALNHLMPEDIAVTVHLTITSENESGVMDLMKKLAEAGVTHLSLSTNNEALSKTLTEAGQFITELGLTQVWDLPVPYSGTNPVALELDKSDDDFPDGAGKAWMYVEPDGDVLPAQGINRVLGNILRDPWKKIWKKSGS